jgi:monoamine oxidase
VPDGPLRGVPVLVAGAGLAGLAAARDLAARGADLTIVEPRDRVGGRAWTIRNGFAERQHAEAGGDMIDEAQTEIRALAGEVGLKLSPILRGGFGLARRDGSGRTKIVARNASNRWDALSKRLEDLGKEYKLAERRWDSPATAAIARRSVAQWLDEIRADRDLRATATGLRGFFLADPEDLSLVAMVDQFTASDEPAGWRMYRIDGGNDRLAARLAAPFSDRLRLNTELVALSHRGREVRASLRHDRTVSQISCEYVVLTMPATLLRRIPITPALPVAQHEAIARLKYGNATKTLMQFSNRFWRAAGRPRAFGSDLEFGALWDGNEEQRGKPGILSLLAGGSASDATQDLVSKSGMTGLKQALDWLGSSGAELIHAQQVVWETDPWARGGYAFFDPGFDTSLRPWLARPAGRLFFAGEHTSFRWQGYMNGAVESGRRAAAEVAATHQLGIEGL